MLILMFMGGRGGVHGEGGREEEEEDDAQVK